MSEQNNGGHNFHLEDHVVKRTTIYSQSVALATERVHQKRFYTEQGDFSSFALEGAFTSFYIIFHTFGCQLLVLR
jgi:hypothetical protein